MPAPDGDTRRERLATACVYLIVTLDGPAADELAPVAAALASGAIDLVQLRDVSGDEARIHARALALKALCAEHDALLILNDHPALAAELDLDGAHVGRDDLPAAQARALLGPHRLLGVSTHDEHELAEARTLPCDHAGLGPCYPTASKDLAYEPGGPALLARCLPAAGALPVFPIGGITPERAGALAAAGATRAAVGAGILTAPDPAEAARVLRLALRGE